LIEINRLVAALTARYEEGEKDYWMPPLVRYDEEYAGSVEDGDVLLFCLRRGDRQAQIVEAITEMEFKPFPVRLLPNLSFVSLVQYQQKFAHLPAMFPSIRPKNTLGEVISKNKLRQLRISESEKYSHVTYFFNGRNTQAFEGEERFVEKSPKSSDFEANPGTRTLEVALKTASAMSEGKYSFILVNLAAGDIIGHIDNWKLNVRCAEEVDKALGIICKGAEEEGYAVVVTADHGLLEVTKHKDGSPSVEHTLSKVLFNVYGIEAKPAGDARSAEHSLADVAPTVLHILGLEKPEEMTGRSLIERSGEPRKCILVILDGWGLGESDPNTNPIQAATTPWFDRFSSQGAFLPLTASGLCVGLPEGRSGNSETGHLTIGCGRVIPQDELRISNAVKKGEIDRNEALIRVAEKCLASKTKPHVVLMLSDKSSHGNMSEGAIVAQYLESRGVRGTRIHVVLDGRSTPIRGAPALLEILRGILGNESSAVLASAMGRGILLDRSGNYLDTTKKAYEGLVLGKGIHF
jgi:2,3-bisphosphoglycerate-independent phosphoglycerate mutase